jgi:hypothetical protein
MRACTCSTMPRERQRMASAAFDLVSARFSWDRVVRCFVQGIGLPVAI